MNECGRGLCSADYDLFAECKNRPKDEWERCSFWLTKPKVYTTADLHAQIAYLRAENERLRAEIAECCALNDSLLPESRTRLAAIPTNDLMALVRALYTAGKVPHLLTPRILEWAGVE